MSATRLLVLGVVRTSGRAHGYQVRRELLGWGAEQWASVNPGSIYHALRQLLKSGMLRSARVEESGEGPERTPGRFSQHHAKPVASSSGSAGPVAGLGWPLMTTSMPARR